MKYNFRRSFCVALAFVLAGGLVFVGLKALEAKGRPLPSWQVEIPHINSGSDDNLLGESDNGTAVFDGFRGDDDELVWVGVIGSTTFALGFRNVPENHIVRFPGLGFDLFSADVTGPYCGFPGQSPGECDENCTEVERVAALYCLEEFMSQDHTLPNYNLTIRVYTKGDPPVEIQDIGTDGVWGGVHIELTGYNTGGDVHDVDCRVDPDMYNSSGIFINRTSDDADEWRTFTSGTVLECTELYWEVTQHPKNRNKFIYERVVSVKALTQFAFNATWTKTK